MLLLAATVFSSGFLLFLVQPIIAKQILPWFGGSAAVWTTCMVFFQVLLLAGYAYADGVTRKLAPRAQAILHTALLAASLALLPIIPADAWKPLADSDPALRILLLLGATIGLPYFLLSTTGPLLQAWFARRFPGATVYRLFALSNLASLAALVAYPPLIEPFVTLNGQAVGWSAFYGVFVLLCATSAWLAARAPMAAAATQAAAAQAAADAPPPRWRDYALWLALAALGSLMLLAVTNHVTQNVASVPFLWIVPLVLYLASFILVFDVGAGRGASGWYSRKFFLWPLLALIVAMAWGLSANDGVLHVYRALPLYCVGLFVACMFCHGELAAMRPAPRYLTRFYLMISLGGAIGGLFVGLVAPKIFNAFYELPVALIVLGPLAALLAFPAARVKGLPRLAFAASLGATAASAYFFSVYAEYLRWDALYASRNFYGTLRVKQNGHDKDPEATRWLVHGVIDHGSEFVSPDRRMTPISYFGPSSGIARALDFYAGKPRKIGVVGLGVGVFTAYGTRHDSFRVYELDPEVWRIAREYFWYLPGSQARVDVVIGDGRLSLERDEAQQFDLLSVDAFSSDAIPVHLMTREALRLYRSHIKPDGVIVFNVTNRYLRLAPLVKAIAEAEGMQAIHISDWPDQNEFGSTDYVLVTANPRLVADKRFKDAEPIEVPPGMKPWTDNYNNLIRVLK
jgi:hypothetical protein